MVRLKMVRPKMIQTKSAILLALTACMTLSAQWVSYPTPGTPRLASGKPNLSAPAPRTADGKPDFSGVWAVRTGNAGDLYYFLDISKVVGPLPYKPGVGEMAHARGAPENKLTQPITHCLPTGLLVEHTVPASMGG